MIGLHFGYFSGAAIPPSDSEAKTDLTGSRGEHSQRIAAGHVTAAAGDFENLVGDRSAEQLDPGANGLGVRGPAAQTYRDARSGGGISTDCGGRAAPRWRRGG